MAHIGLVAHDDKKDDLCAWAERHKAKLSQHQLWGTGTTGSRVMAATGMTVTLLKSGPLGGDQQLGAMICEGKLDMLIFFIDPMSAQPHDVDVKALTRLATLYDVPLANNRSTADAVLAFLPDRTDSE
ncbi:methylglyoxal synthase [Devosia sp. BK]|uniref:methylglyoxal synthase n=1 Tax=unclassified Devosia TaxID=196773 RepID=UPI000712BE0B|nr:MULTISPECIES: methylglyoxal synthase [unclassified Devosia]KQN76401.1 methylglyoxal synthase [Devosia sp. Leaf64]MDV3252156.1 methylglyoxal synthase [Devosia sp. BK]